MFVRAGQKDKMWFELSLKDMFVERNKKTSWGFKPSTSPLMAWLFPTWASSVVRAAQFVQRLDVCVCMCACVTKLKYLNHIFPPVVFPSTNHLYFEIYKLKYLFTPPHTHTHASHTQTHMQTLTYTHSWGQLVKLKRLHFSFECSMISIIGINKAVSFGRDGSFWQLFPAPSQLVSGEETTKQGSH